MSTVFDLKDVIPHDVLVALHHMARPTGILVPRDLDGELGLLLSKIGGLPDLESPDAWPRRAGKRLSFLAQIAGQDFERVAPGRFSDIAAIAFFFDTMEMPAGLAPSDRSALGMVITKTGQPVRRIPAEGAAGPTHLFMEQPLEVVVASSYPPVEWTEVDALFRTSEEQMAYINWLDALRDAQAPLRRSRLSKILGQPDPIQSDFRQTCEMCAAGREPAYDDNPTTIEGSRHWDLIIQFAFQLTTMDGEEVDWHDVGKLLVMARTNGCPESLMAGPIWAICESH